MSAERVIHRLTTIFGEPKTENPADYVDEFVQAMDGYEDAILMAACDEIIRTATFFPRPGELLAIARRKSAERHAASSRGAEIADDQMEKIGPEDERFVRALTKARTDAPAYARMIEARGWIKVRKLPDGPRKAATVAVLSDVTKRMTGERD